MATKTLTKPGAGLAPFNRPYNSYQLENTIDFSVAANVLAQNDIAELIAVPANCSVIGIRWEILVVEGAARNFAIGDGAGTSSYIATTSANSLAEGAMALALTEGTPNTITGYSDGKYYAAADTIDILAVTSGGLTTCKLRVVADIRDYN